jgi:hypothetical protein
VGLWEVLRAGGGEQNIANIQHLVKHAIGKLILVRDTFPDYTLHDRQHAENVIVKMELLLGPDVAKASPLEAAMLILAAYFHDIGMVYDPDELAALIEEEDFQNFLDENPAAYVRARQAEEMPGDVIVEYCRARHADRVSEHLAELDPTLQWDGVSIARELGTLCQSHNQPLEALRSEKFSTAFRASCDLRMCAILLRLADILDFDDSRSPTAVYAHLRLANAAGGPRTVSDIEWSKHLASRGFQFPAARSPGYSLVFLASPRRPAVENAIRKFLDVVEEELRGCRILLDFCDRRWQQLILPGDVDRSDIVAAGYRYGEYRFSLDRREVLRLFMGDQLYADPYVFIRELVQNAIDACRLNVYLHEADQAAIEVRVSAWEDDAGNYWLRVDDTGVGMDQGIVEKYFLGVGRSYYRSDELQADILRKNKPQQKFVAISRFGIGVLSSFIVGDRIEVSSRRRLPNGKLATPLRLSLDSLDDFFVLQEPSMVPSPFPGRTGPELGYRKKAGTSVAVRIDPTKSDVTLAKLLDRARRAFFFPPVRVFLNDVEQQGHRFGQLDVPLIRSAIRHSVTAQPQARPRADLLATTELTVVAIPLDLTGNSPTPAVRGQLVAVTAEVEERSSLLSALPAELRSGLPEELARSLGECIVERRSSVHRSDNGALIAVLNLECRRRALEELRDWLGSPRFRDTAQEYYPKDRVFEMLFGTVDMEQDHGPPHDRRVSIEDHYPLEATLLGGVAVAHLRAHDWLGHNGISVSTRLEKPRASYDSQLRLLQSSVLAVFGAVCLLDELRPDVSTSRDTLRHVPFAIRSALHLAFRRAVSVHLASPERAHALRIMQHNLLSELPLREVTAAQVENDQLLPEWRAEQIIQLASGTRHTVEELRQLAASHPVEINLPDIIWSREHDIRDYMSERNFYQTLQLALADQEFDIEMTPPDPEFYWRKNSFTVRSANRPARPPGLSALPPLSAVRHSSRQVVIAPNSPANLRHAVIAWFAEQAATLQTDYPALFAQFKRALAMVANLDGYQRKEVTQQTAGDAAELLNATLDRIRRSVPDVPRVLSVEIYAGSRGELLSRP